MQQISPNVIFKSMKVFFDMFHVIIPNSDYILKDGPQLPLKLRIILSSLAHTKKYMNPKYTVCVSYISCTKTNRTRSVISVQTWLESPFMN